MSYIVAQDVDSPRGRWRLHLVLYDGGEGNWAAAEGQWENNGRWDAVLAIRWNGKDGDKLGNPQSRGRPTWFIVPKELEPAIRAVISNRRSRTGESTPGDGPKEAAVTAQEWVARKLDVQSDWGGGLPRPITRRHENRRECIADAKRELGIHLDGKLPPDVRIEHVGEVDDDTLFGEWVARRGHLQRCRVCDAEQERAKAGMAARWRYHLDKATDLAVLRCQQCSRESKLPVDWRDEAELP